MHFFKNRNFHFSRNLLMLFAFIVLVSCSKNSSNSDAITSGVIKVEATYPENFMDYELEVTTIAASYDVTKIDYNKATFNYINDTNFTPSNDPENFPLVSGNTKHTFQTSDHAIALSMLFSSNNTDGTIKEGVPVNLKIYFNNTLQEDVNIDTRLGRFDFTWTTQDDFLYDGR